MLKKIILLLLISSSIVFANGGNETITNFNKSKKLLERVVYEDLDKKTIYCEATFSGKKIIDFNGYESIKYKKRKFKLEWEHILPAENFGRIFPEWDNGHELCVRKSEESVKKYKGRACVSKIRKEYRLMQSDLYNLYPAIGAVNGMRRNYNFVEANGGDFLGECKISIKNRKVVPPNHVKGLIARTYMYMDSVYDKYRMSRQQRKLFKVWDKLYPVTDEECKRSKIIEDLQGNKNMILESRCKENY